MERLAWIEVLNRHGDVESRHPVSLLPAKIGRAYDCDLILDDPYIAPAHVEITAQDEGSFRIRDMGSINGVTIANTPGRQAVATVTPDDIIRIGHTQLRIRPNNYPVTAETKYSAKSWQRRPTVLFLSTLAFLAVLIASALLNYTETNIGSFVTPVIIVCVMVVVWIVAWSFGGRLFAGKSNFIPHAVIGTLGVTLFLASNMLVDLVSFTFDSALVSSLAIEVAFLVFMLVLYWHLRLISRARPRIVAGIAGAVALLIVGTNMLISNIRNENDLEHQSYRDTIGPPFLLMVEGKSPEAFIDSMEGLKTRVQE